MKNQLIQFTAIALIFISCNQQSNSNMNEINKAVISFVKAADQQNVSNLKNVLHPEFRALANRLFGSEELQVISKEVYIQLINDKKIGGDDRIVEIRETQVIGHNAYVSATFTGNETKFDSFVLLAQNSAGNWKIVSDMPYVEKLQ